MNFRKIIIVMLILEFSIITKQSASEHANPQNSLISCASLNRLVTFVTTETSYTPIADCPQVHVTNNEVLKMMIPQKSMGHGDSPAAIYLPASSKILVSVEIDLTELLGQSYLLHELVHAHQLQNGVATNVPCLGWLEREAYQIQAKFLRQNGSYADANTFEFLGMLQSACAQAYHPDFNIQ